MQCGVGRVGRIGQCRWRNVPSFGFVGSNLAFQAALAEAANTGLALGFSGPNASPQYWLRGTKYSNFLGVPGATYTRTGSRAGLDAAVVYSANVPRIAAVNGLRVHGAGTNQARNSTATGGTVGVIGSGGVAPTNWNIQGAGLTREIISITNDVVRIRFSGTPSSTFVGVLYNSPGYSPASPGQIWTASRYARLVAGTLPAAALNEFNIAVYRYDSGNVYLDQSGSVQTFNGSNFVRSVHTAASIPAGTAFIATVWTVNINNGVPVDFTIDIASPQLEQSAFATDYIPNPNTSGSSSAGADVPLVSYATGTEFTAIVQWVEPPAIAAATRLLGVTLGTDPSVLEINSPTTLGSWNGSVFINGTTATRAAESIQRAVFRQTGAGRQIHYNGAQIISDANPLAAISQLCMGCTFAGGGSLNSGLQVVSIIPRDIGATQANAVSLLP